jgi:hypothetical protein
MSCSISKEAHKELTTRIKNKKKLLQEIEKQVRVFFANIAIAEI